MMPGGIRFVRAAEIADDPGPQPLRYAGIHGRQFFSLMKNWPELAQKERMTGIYHALGGPERRSIDSWLRGTVERQGFEVLRPASMVFEQLPFGPLAQLAITFGCRGPFWCIEADELAGVSATLQALEDLAEGRCDQAIVAGYRYEPAFSRVLFLVRDDTGDLAWHVRFTHGSKHPESADIEATEAALGGPLVFVESVPNDDHGLAEVAEALELAQSGTTAAVWRHVSDGRGVLLGFRAKRFDGGP